MGRILITGAGGVLGTSLRTHFSGNGSCVFGTTKEEMNVTKKDAVLRILEAFKPDVVFHLAALTNLELCEQNPDLAYQVHVVGTKNVVDACNSLGATILYMSTGAVFDGTKQSPYTEDDTPNPLSVYGKTKYEAERIVVEHALDCIVVRLGWLFGGFEKESKFVAPILRMIQNGHKELFAVQDMKGSPTYTEDVAVGIERLLTSGARGMFHVVNAGVATRYDQVKCIVAAAGKTIPIVPVSHHHFADKYSAPRPINESLSGQKMSALYEMPHWTVSLEKYVRLSIHAA